MINQPDISLGQQLATPLWFPQNAETEEIELLTAQMVERAFAVRAFMEGRITWDDLLSLLDDHGIDAIQCHEDWSEGLFYM